MIGTAWIGRCRRIAVPSIAVAVAGCASDQATANRYSLGDTMVVENVSPLIADTLHPVEVRRYGRAEGELEYLLSRVFTFAVGPDGDVYVHDDGGGIRRFGRDGEYVGHVARSGEGPAEVEYLAGLDVAADGRVVAHDLGNQRVSVFEEGVPEWLTRRPEGQPRYRNGDVRWHGDGTIWVGVTPRMPPTGGVTHPRPAFVRVGEEGGYPDTIFTPADAAANCPDLSESQYRAGFWEDAREPFVPKVKWALGSDGTFVVGCPASYTFDAYRRDGSITRISRTWTPVLVTDEERDFRARFGRSDRVPRERPAYSRIVVPGDGRYWVWPTQPNVKEALPAESVEQFGITHTWVVSWQGAFDVFDADGTWRAVVRLPEDARFSGFPTEPPVVIRGDTIWAVAEDELDIDYVVRYEVRGLSMEG